MESLRFILFLCISFGYISSDSIYTGFGTEFLYAFSIVDGSTIFQVTVPPLVTGSDVQITAATMQNGSDIVWMWAESLNTTSRRIVGMNVTTNQFIEGATIPNNVSKASAFFFAKNGSLYGIYFFFS